MIDELLVADSPEAWESAGFTVDPDGVCRVGTVRLRLLGEGELGGASIRQVFYRLGDVILEVVGSPDTAGDGPASLWGITFVVDDIDAASAFFGGNTSPVKEAVQPGRRITTLRHRQLGMSVRTALITPHPTTSSTTS